MAATPATPTTRNGNQTGGLLPVGVAQARGRAGTPPGRAPPRPGRPWHPDAARAVRGHGDRRHPGDRAHQPATSVLRVAAPPTTPTTPTPVYVPPTSVTFGHVISCKRVQNNTDVDVTYTVVAHGGEYTDEGGYGTVVDKPVHDTDNSILEVPAGVYFTGNGQLPPGPVTFTPDYDKNLAPLGGTIGYRFAHTHPLEGTLPDEATPC